MNGWRSLVALAVLVATGAVPSADLTSSGASEARQDQISHQLPRRANGRYFSIESALPGSGFNLVVRTQPAGKPQLLVGYPPAVTLATAAGYAPSENGTLVAYRIPTADGAGSEIRVVDSRSARHQSDTLRSVGAGNIAWTRDNRGFFYTRVPSPADGAAAGNAVAGDLLFYHTLGEAQSRDFQVVLPAGTEDMLYSVDVSWDGFFAVISATQRGNPHNLIYLIDLGPRGNRFNAPLVRLIPNFMGKFNYVRSDSTNLYFTTDFRAPNGRIISIDVNRPRPESWSTVVGEQQKLLVSTTSAYLRFIAHYRDEANSTLTIFTLRGTAIGTVPLDVGATVHSVGANPRFDEVFFSATAADGRATAVTLYDLERKRLTPIPPG